MKIHAFSPILFVLLALPLQAQESDRASAEKPAITWESIDASEFAAKLEKANAAGEGWAANPETILVQFAGPFVTKGGEKMGQSRTIRLISKGEGIKTLNAILIDDGLFDDSTKTARLRLVLARTGEGTWKLRKVFRSSEKWPRP